METNPSTSPEHYFIAPDGKKACVSYSTTMDMSIIREVFSAVILSADVSHSSILKEKAVLIMSILQYVQINDIVLKYVECYKSYRSFYFSRIIFFILVITMHNEQLLLVIRF